MPLSRLLVGAVFFLAFVVALGTLAGKCPELDTGPSPTRVEHFTFRLVLSHPQTSGKSSQNSTHELEARWSLTFAKC